MQNCNIFGSTSCSPFSCDVTFTFFNFFPSSADVWSWALKCWWLFSRSLKKIEFFLFECVIFSIYQSSFKFNTLCPFNNACALCIRMCIVCHRTFAVAIYETCFHDYTLKHTHTHICTRLYSIQSVHIFIIYAHLPLSYLPLNDLAIFSEVKIWNVQSAILHIRWRVVS